MTVNEKQNRIHRKRRVFQSRIGMFPASLAMALRRHSPQGALYVRRLKEVEKILVKRNEAQKNNPDILYRRALEFRSAVFITLIKRGAVGIDFPKFKVTLAYKTAVWENRRQNAVKDGISN